jgi:16S rRNA (uracil1498-N3)-methyltransferase
MIRIFNENISEKITINGEQFAYLQKVMRVQIGEEIAIFNANDGEFLFQIANIEKRLIEASKIKLLRKFQEPKRKIFCVFSKIKQKNAELIIQKCTEIGVYAFIPMVTARTVEKNLNIERLSKIAVEACEQCGRLDIPKILPEITINELPKLGENLILLSQFSEKSSFKIEGSAFVISGPEGGFTNQELGFLEGICTKFNVSKNILRSETAAILGCGIVANSIL